MARADEIPRYAPPTQAELEAMFGDVASPCETCTHRITVKVGRRTRDICVAEHDEDGEDFGTVIASVVGECGRWELVA